MENRSDLVSGMLRAFGEGANVLASGLPNRREENTSLISHLKHEAVHKIKNVVLRRMQKAMIPYRLRMAW